MFQVIFKRSDDAARSCFFEDESDAERHGINVMLEQRRYVKDMAQRPRTNNAPHAQVRLWASFWVERVPTLKDVMANGA